MSVPARAASVSCLHCGTSALLRQEAGAAYLEQAVHEVHAGVQRIEAGMTAVTASARLLRLTSEKCRLEEEGSRIVAQLESPEHAPPGAAAKGVSLVVGGLLVIASLGAIGNGSMAIGILVGIAGVLLLRRAWRTEVDPLEVRLGQINGRLKALRADIRDIERETGLRA